MRAFVFLLALVLLPSAGLAQADGNASDPHAEMLMRQMVAALGGAQWLAVRDVMEAGRTSSFYQGKPTGVIGDFRLWRTVPASADDPGLTRTEYSKQHDVVGILTKDVAWEITYKGKRQLPPEEYGTAFRRRDHSLDEAVRIWWHEPGTVLFSNGQKMVDRRLVDEVTMLNDRNDNITLDMDAYTHLPLRVAFTWRDPLYKDHNEDATEYADYHPVQGLPTPFNVSVYHNGDMTTELYLSKVEYNAPLPLDAFDVDATTAKIKR